MSSGPADGRRGGPSPSRPCSGSACSTASMKPSGRSVPSSAAWCAGSTCTPTASSPLVSGWRSRRPLVHLERLRLADELPLALDRVWFPYELAAPLLDADFSTGALYQRYADLCGVVLTGGDETVQPSCRRRPSIACWAATRRWRRSPFGGSDVPRDGRWSGGTPSSAVIASSCARTSRAATATTSIFSARPPWMIRGTDPPCGCVARHGIPPWCCVSARAGRAGRGAELAS